MYECSNISLMDACKILGLGRNTVLRLCQERTNGFPAVKVGARRYMIDGDKLMNWRERWYAGEFTI